MLLLVRELCEGGARFLLTVSKYKHKHFQDYKKTGSTLGFLGRVPVILPHIASPCTVQCSSMQVSVPGD